MIRSIIFTFLLTFSASMIYCQSDVIDQLDKKSDHYASIAHTIWQYAELGYLEEKSSNLLQSELQKQGFKVTAGVAGIPTAFEASFGSGEPIIGIMGEFDALPGVSQEASPERKAIKEGGAGHACGHHLFGTGSMAAAIAAKDWLVSSGKSGTIKFFGTPAEEGGAGKVYMAREGLFDAVDVMLHWHPSDGNSASAASSLANKSGKFRFYGVASHAAAAPENGKSALDGVEAMNFMANMLREHIPMESRLHYVITSGGEAPNVVPAFAEVFYYCRHPDMAMVRENFEKLVTIAEAAAMGTGTTMEYEVIHGIYNVLPNETLSRIMHKNLEKVGAYSYNPAEKAFAVLINETLPEAAKKDLESVEKIAPFIVRERGTGGSTDVGDVSWHTPTAGMRAATWVPGTSAHTWQAVAAGGMSIGEKGMMVAAKTISLTAIDIFNDPSVCAKAKEELLRRRGSDFKYEPLLGDREPPLDYRKGVE